MHYPIKNKSVDSEQFLNFVHDRFCKQKNKEVVIWIPHLIYEAAKEFSIPVRAIKELIISLHENDHSKYVMERSSFQVMEYAGRMRNYEQFQDLLVEHKGFIRNNLIINN